MAEMFGAVAGIQAADQDIQAKQMTNLALAEGSQKLEMNQLTIDQTKATLDKQKKMLAAMSQMHDQGQQDPSAQAKALAGQMFGYSKAAGEAGLPEESFEFSKKGIDLLKNSSDLEIAHLTELNEDATLTSNLMANVHDKKGFEDALMVFQTVRGKPSKFTSEQYSPELVGKIRDTATTLIQQSTIKKDQAEARKADADAQLAGITGKLRTAQIEHTKATTAALGKEGIKPPAPEDIKDASSLITAGDQDADPAAFRIHAVDIAERAKRLIQGGMTRAEAYQSAYNAVKEKGDLTALPQKPAKAAAAKSQAALRNDVSSSIDDLTKQIQSDPDVVGAKGFVSRTKEFAKTTTGLGDQGVPAAKYKTAVEALLLKLPKTLTGSSRSAADERRRVDEIANSLKLGTSPQIALGQLQELKKIIERQNAGSISGKDTAPSVDDLLKKYGAK